MLLVWHKYQLTAMHAGRDKSLISSVPIHDACDLKPQQYYNFLHHFLSLHQQMLHLNPQTWYLMSWLLYHCTTTAGHKVYLMLLLIIFNVNRFYIILFAIHLTVIDCSWFGTHISQLSCISVDCHARWKGYESY